MPGVEAAELRAPIAGLAEATLRLTKGVGHLRIRGEAGLPDLFRGTFPSNPPTARVDRGVVSIQYRRSPFGWRARPGDLAVTDAVRWRLEISGGVSGTVAELHELDVRSVTVSGGVSHAFLVLPPPRGIVPVHVAGGVNALSVVRPAGTAARLRVRGGASNVDFDGRRFSAMGRDAGGRAWTVTARTSTRSRSAAAPARCRSRRPERRRPPTRATGRGGTRDPRAGARLRRAWDAAAGEAGAKNASSL